MTQAISDAEQRVNDWVEVWNTGAYERLPDVLAEEATVHDPGAPGGVLEGCDAFEAHLRELRRGFPDLTIDVDGMLSEEGVVMVHWTATGTHEGEFDGIPPTGREVDFEGMSYTTVRNGHVVEDRVYHDFHEFLRQLGLVEDGG
jgi:steroid delta-isomerase-like uncharacterized protein